MHNLSKRKNTINMTEGPLFGKILFFSLPLMASGILQLLFNAADVIVVGRFAGENALAAVGSTGALINLILNLFIGLSTGASVCASNAIGAKDNERIRRCVHTSMALAISGGLVAMILGLFLSRPLLSLMGTKESLLDDAALYMRIYFLGVPASLIFNFAAGLIRAEGDTKRPLYILTISGVVNVVFNLFFVIVCHLGVAGVAIATAISNAVSMVLIVSHIMKLDSKLKYIIKDTRIYKRELFDVVRIGIPSGMSGMMFSISNAIIQSSINIFPETTVAGNTAASNIEGFIYTSMNSFYQASQTFTSQNLGAGKVKRINKVLKNSLIQVVLVGVALCALALTFRRHLLGLYVTGENVDAVIKAGMERMMVICSTYYFCGIMDVLGGSLRGMKYSFSTMIISMLGACAFRIIWLATVFKADQTVFNVYVSYPISWILTALAYLVCYVYAYRKIKKRYTPEISL